MKSELLNPKDILLAAQRVQQFVYDTPVLTSKSLNQLSGAGLFCKCENLQKTGSFKIRGVTNTLKILEDSELPSAVATHSSGNHGAALASAAGKIGLKAYIVMPENSARVKKQAVRTYGGMIISCEPNLEARETTLSRILNENNAEEIPPYNDSRIIAGQGTAALELCSAVADLDCIVTPVGGGGLLSGTALALQTSWPNVRLFGAEPLNANDAQQSLISGRLMPATNTDTVADGLRTSLGDLNFSIIHKYVERILTVTDEQILSSLRLIWERMKLLVEPSGAVPLAVVLNHPEIFQRKRVGLIFSGGNVDLETTSSWF